MTYRISESMINVEGTLMVNTTGDWKPYIDRAISSIQLQNLYLFLHEENKANMRAFSDYVDRVLNKLIYNEH